MRQADTGFTFSQSVQIPGRLRQGDLAARSCGMQDKSGLLHGNVVFLDNGFTLVVLTNDQDYDTDPFVFKILNAVCGSSQLDSNC